MKRFRRYGKRRIQRYRCNQCGKTFSDHEGPLGNLRTPLDTALRVVSCLAEGCSVWSTARICNVHKRTVIAILHMVAERCESLMAEKVRDVPVELVQCDEIWGYVFKKEGHKTEEEAGNPLIGDAYTFVGIEAKSKLILCYELGKRDGVTTLAFIGKLQEATGGRFQLTTDGFKPYVGAVEEIFGADIDFAQLVKLYYSDEQTRERYSPGQVIETIPVPIQGEPDPSQISTSYIERQNLTMRMCMRRLTRLTNGFSKKWANLKAALALYVAHYNFCRIHQTLRVTPAMEAGITDHVWRIEELLDSSTGA
jgi:IS1 family transposase